MKCKILILLILTSGGTRSQDYFFEFIEGWKSDYCVELEESYRYIGLDIADLIFEHTIQIYDVNGNGDNLFQLEIQSDSLSALSMMSNSQMFVRIDETIYHVGLTVGDDAEIKGALYKQNLLSLEFELLGNYSGSNNTRFFNILNPNDTTLLVGASLTDFDASPIVSLYNFNLEGEERWRKDIESCVQCFADPIHILSLSNGNIAYMYEEFEEDFAFTDTQRAIIVIMNGETGEQIGDEILVGDHDNYRIWAGGMVEQDGEILVSYTQPYYYDEDGEWQTNFDNTYFISSISLLGDVLWETDLSDPLVNGSSANIAGVFYRVTQMQKLDDGSILLSGTSGVEGILTKISAIGDLEWYNNYRPHTFEENPVASNLQIYYATPTSDGGFMMAGKYESDPGDLYPQGIQTAIALKVDEYGCLEEDCQVGVEELEENSLSIYPNPSSGRFVIELPSFEKSSLKIFNALGEEVMFEDGIIGEMYEVDLTNFPQGVYLVQLQVIERSRNAGPSTDSGTFQGVYSSKIIKE